jgi:ferritin-like metal-binding protein YciE
MGQSSNHVASLERAFELMSERPRRKGCNAMEGLLAESECLMAESSRVPVRDSAILAAIQKIGHYEIATYTTLREWAQQLGRLDVSAVLQQVLEEEIAADKALSQLALTLDNEAARAE